MRHRQRTRLLEPDQPRRSHEPHHRRRARAEGLISTGYSIYTDFTNGHPGRAIGSLATYAAPEAGTGAFLPGAQGGEGLGSLAGRSVNVSERGLAQVQEHLAQFGSHPPNDAMIGRLSNALANGQPVTGADASFYMHELTESTLMRQGMDYETAHGAALAKYGVSPFSVYAPEVIQKMPEYFNSNWSDFWGVGR